jgi:hypothetical protein
MASPLLRITLSALLCAVFASPARTQVMVSAKDLPEAIRVLDNAPAKDALGCGINVLKKVYLDFVFRYITAFSIDCRFGIVQPGMTLFALVRIKPEDGRPVLMIEEFDLPQYSRAEVPDPSALRRVHFFMSGGLATGPGRYSVEVVLTDQKGNTSRTQRNLKAGKDGSANRMPLALAPGAVAPLLDAHWNGKLTTDGFRVTVLLHTEGRGFGAVDRVDLLESLTELLSQMPCQSVKLIAFNLDRQEELFRQDSFDSDGFVKLAKVMEQKEFVTISYKALIRGAWEKFLLQLAQNEATAKEPPEAVVFIGQGGTHAWDKLPKDAIRKIEASDTHFFYLKYFSWIGPTDALEQLTKDLHGSVFQVRSPETLAQAIRKMTAQIKATEKSSLRTVRKARALTVFETQYQCSR